MTVGPVGFPVTPPVAPAAPTGGADALAGTAGAAKGDFGATLSGGLEKLQQLNTTADGLAVQAATGDLRDVHDYMIASTEASLATELTVAVRNKAVEAFNDIMRMPL